jgi:hypothetical protein
MMTSRLGSTTMLAMFLWLCSHTTQAADACISQLNGIQLLSGANGQLQLYVYSKEFPSVGGNGNTYFFYSGDNETAKVFQAQLLFAKASGAKVCVTYTPSTPSYRWVMTAVGVADADAWPWQS